jgi:pimeloyl-ACP methyl ester carboxylesterase
MRIQRQTARRGDLQPVIALHCSGAGAGQWRQLGEVLDSRYDLIAPEHYGCESVGPWSGAHAFTLADEAAVTIEIIDRADSTVHLVGHSYGGGVALRAAVERPDRIASLTLYEPSAFHLLKAIGVRGAHALAEIQAIASMVDEGVITGDYCAAATSFVDYWGGRGAWAALRPSVQAALTRWVAKAPLDFRALIGEATPLSAYADLRFPVLIMRGEHAPAPSRLIAETLRAVMPTAGLMVVANAGHMGPLTHAAEVNAAIARHLAESQAKSRQHSPFTAAPYVNRIGALYSEEVAA